MATKQREPFNRGLKFYARKDMVYHGQRYARGDQFFWRRLSCSERVLRRLYDSRYLECGASVEQASGEPSKEEQAAKRKAAGIKAAETRKRNKAKLKAEADARLKAEAEEQRKAEAEAGAKSGGSSSDDSGEAAE